MRLSLRSFLTLFCFLIFILGIAFEFGCVHRTSRSYEWNSNSPLAGPKPTTVVVLLIDGLGLSVFDELDQQALLPNLRSFFGETRFSVRSVFPSLTFPNISSLLTSRPMGAHPVSGNKVQWVDSEVLNFESPVDMPQLQEILKPQTLFEKLRQKHLRSWSLSYSFNFGSPTILRTNIGAGLQYVGEDYDKLDADTLRQSLHAFERLGRDQWPSFVFIHLIGLDAVSHLYGPYSPQAVSYLQNLDRQLQPLLRWLDKNDSTQRSITTLMLSDHGFEKVSKTFEIENVIETLVPRNHPTPLILNEMRMAALHFTKRWSANAKLALAQALSQNPDVQAVLTRIGNSQIHLNLKDRLDILELVPGQSCRPYSFAIRYQSRVTCSQVLDLQAPQRDLYKLFENAGAYFSAESSPDMVILAANGVGFAKQYLGQHGGMTAEELKTPILMRNSVVTAGSSEIPIYEILESFSF